MASRSTSGRGDPKNGRFRADPGTDLRAVCGTASPRAGMRWSRVGTEKLLPIRSAILSKRFDELWTKVYNAPQA